jgi:transcriptional regulator with XRE-family HTH domain
MIPKVSIVMATIEQIKAARALIGWSQEDLAMHSGVSMPTVKRLESRSKLRVSEEARLKMEAALESAGIEFTNGDKPGLRLSKPRKD